MPFHTRDRDTWLSGLPVRSSLERHEAVKGAHVRECYKRGRYEHIDSGGELDSRSSD